MLLSGRKVDLGAALLAGSGLAQFADGKTATEIHLPGVAVAPDLDVEFLAERVDATHAHAVQAAGDFVGGGIEFAAGVELGEDHLHRRHHLAVAHRHHVHGNAAAIVDHGDGVVDVDDDFDLLGVAGQRFIDGVIDHLIDQVVQAHLAGRADVHGRTKAHRLQAFENLDVFAGVAAVVAASGGEGLLGCVDRHSLSRHRVLFARLSLCAPQELCSGLYFRARLQGINRLKNGGFETKSPGSILPCGDRSEAGAK